MSRFGINQRIADRLLADRLIREPEHQRVVDLASKKGVRVEEVLLDLKLIEEPKLLKYIATVHKTQFVSTERMSKAKIDREALRVVSYKLATQYGVYPLVLDRTNDKLIVATADPDDGAMIQDLRAVAGVSRVLPMVARPDAVIAAIARGYEGDRSLFTRLLYASELGLEHSAPAPGPRQVIDDPLTGEYAPGSGDYTPAGGGSGAPRSDDTDRGYGAPHRSPPPRPPSYQRRSYPSDDEPASDATPTGYSTPPSDEPAHLEREQGAPPRHRSIVPPMKRVSHAAMSFGSLTERQTRTDPPETSRVLSSVAYLESLRVLVGLLENNRPDLRGHSSQVARLTLDVCERIAMPADAKNAVTLAAYLHDLGKMGSAHVTALNVARDDWHRKLAQKIHQIPVRLMESVRLPADTIDAVTSMYEQVGGRGLPRGLVGKDIPMGARILAAVDSYADLTLNPNNVHGALLSADEAVALLRQHRDVFDANIVEVLAKSTSGERIVSDLLADRHRVLIVDPDPEETMVLQLRLAEQGFDVHLARTLAEAHTALASREYAVVVSEVDLDQAAEGLSLREQLGERGRATTWVFLSSSSDRRTVSRAFELGADDFITKPAPTEIVVAKLTQLLERQATRVAPRGVSGSLAEMGLTDLVQVLWHGRKTCALRISQGDRRGVIEFASGRIVNAAWDGATGETAFYRILALGEQGDFEVDPAFVPGPAQIRESPEALLLEGMRLIDEGIVP